MIFSQVSEQFGHLKNVLQRLTEKQYTQPAHHLGGATVGGHTRHILELFQCAAKGRETGTVDYENRERDLALERNKDAALELLLQLETKVKKEDKPLHLRHAGDLVPTSYIREVVYNIEHTIHHLALIKVALIEMNESPVDENFGMAYSTIQYKQQLQNK